MADPISPASAPHYVWGADPTRPCDGWHLVRTPGLSVIQERVPPGGREVRHHHERARQFFYVLAGSLTLEVEGTVHNLPPGTGLEIDPGAAHEARNEGAEVAEFLVVSQPPGQGDRVPTPDARAT